MGGGLAATLEDSESVRRRADLFDGRLLGMVMGWVEDLDMLGLLHGREEAGKGVLEGEGLGCIMT